MLENDYKVVKLGDRNAIGSYQQIADTRMLSEHFVATNALQTGPGSFISR